MAGPVAVFEGDGPEDDGRTLVAFASNVRDGSVFLAINGLGHADGNAIRVNALDAIALGVALIRAAGEDGTR